MFYTAHAPKENAGILLMGHSISGHMIIPPHVERYTVRGFCPEKCIDKVSAFKLVICLRLLVNMQICIYLHKYNKYILC